MSPPSAAGARKILECVDVVTNFYTYEGVVKALNQISLVVEHGSTFGLVGESGCGKSVLVRSVMRIVQQPGKIEGGRILLHLNGDGGGSPVDVLQLPERRMEELRGSRVSMIFQEPNASLNPLFTIGDQISESFLFHQKPQMAAEIAGGLDASRGIRFAPLWRLERHLYRKMAGGQAPRLFRILDRIPILRRWDYRLHQEAMRRSIEMLRKLSIPNPEEVVKRHPHNLSGGMKQRVIIAIALACHPALLIADEATSNLDVTIQAQILDLLRDLKRRGEISSILFITHDLGIVAEMCDRVGVMYAGNVCEVASVNEIFSRPLHPYTIALLDSVPKLSQKGELKTIEGNVPNLVTPPPGCRFHPRCSRVLPICRQERPELKDVGGDHWVACYAVGR